VVFVGLAQRQLTRFSNLSSVQFLTVRADLRLFVGFPAVFKLRCLSGFRILWGLSQTKKPSCSLKSNRSFARGQGQFDVGQIKANCEVVSF
jgi:hypothetical protein